MWNVDRIVWSNLTAHISVVRLSLEALAFSVIWSSLSMNVGSQFTNLILTIAFLEWLNANKLKVSYVGPKWIFFLSFSTPTSRRIKNCSIRTNYARSLSLYIYPTHCQSEYSSCYNLLVQVSLILLVMGIGRHGSPICFQQMHFWGFTPNYSPFKYRCQSNLTSQATHFWLMDGFLPTITHLTHSSTSKMTIKFKTTWIPTHRHMTCAIWRWLKLQTWHDHQWCIFW